MTPCPRHPFSPLTHLGCVQCHGEELAGREVKTFSLPGKKRGRPKKNADLNFEDDAPEQEQDTGVQDEIKRTIKGWKGRNTDEWGRWKNA